MTIHQKYMQRCLDLARLGAGYVAPNPMVGAVLVQEDKIIGEGWHQQFGGPHAEVNCITSVKEEDRNLISTSTLYVSLEPCAHHGKTAPCTDLIIQHKIKKVVIGCLDPFKEVNGKGIEKLKAAGVEVELASGEMGNACKELNKRFLTFHTLHRPYVILKWAQTADGKIAAPLNSPQGGTLESNCVNDFLSYEDTKAPSSEGFGEAGGAQRLLISNEYSNRLVHKWRSEEASILIGTNTALLDDPELTTRLWTGPSPVRLVVDMNLRLPASLKIFNDASPTIIFNTKIHSVELESATQSPLVERTGVRAGVRYYQVKTNESLVHQIMNALYQLKIQSVLVEGGAGLLQSFIDEGTWDEVRVIRNEKSEMTNKESGIGSGLRAPVFSQAAKISEQKILTDKIEIFKPTENN